MLLGVLRTNRNRAEEKTQKNLCYRLKAQRTWEMESFCTLLSIFSPLNILTIPLRSLCQHLSPLIHHAWIGKCCDFRSSSMKQSQEELFITSPSTMDGIFINSSPNVRWICEICVFAPKEFPSRIFLPFRNNIISPVKINVELKVFPLELFRVEFIQATPLELSPPIYSLPVEHAQKYTVAGSKRKCQNVYKSTVLKKKLPIP